MKRWIVPLMAAVLAVGMAHVADAQGQGQGQGQGKGQGQGNGQNQAQVQDHHYDDSKDKDKGKYDDKYKGQENHGQVVSDCNHQANSRNLKGQERKDFTEWCESRGARYKYDYNRYGSEKNCYQKANSKGLTGDKRANYLGKCLAENEARYYGEKAPVKKKD